MNIDFQEFMKRMKRTKRGELILIQCPRCGMLHAPEEYECERCGWEFGFETHSPDNADDETVFNLDAEGQPIL